jgi:nucleoid DNA-binding protein
MGLFEDLVKKAARAHNIPIDQAEKAIRYQFSSVVKALESGEHKGIWLQYLGTWDVKEGRKKMIAQKEIHKESKNE